MPGCRQEEGDVLYLHIHYSYFLSVSIFQCVGKLIMCVCVYVCVAECN